MRLPEVHRRLSEACEFPVTHETLVEHVGDRRLEAPTGESVAVETVLNRTDESAYRSADDAYATVVGNLGSPYVGRKYYDDRGRTHHRRTELSF